MKYLSEPDFRHDRAEPIGVLLVNLGTPASPSVARAIHDAVERGLARYPDPMATAFRMQAAQLSSIRRASRQ